MSRFAPALRELARELDLPRGARDAIVRELAADLEALYAHHRQRGVDERAAQRMAEDAVLGSAEVVRRLARLHRHTWRGWSESLGAQLAGGAPLVMLLLGVVPMLAAAAVLAAQAQMTTGGPIVWGMAAVGLVMVVTIGRSAVLLLARSDASARVLALLPVLAAMAGALGVLAASLGLHATLSALASAPGAVPGALLAERLGGAFSVAATGVLLAIAGGFAWFVLLGRMAAQVAREVDALLGGDGSGPGGGATVLQLDRGRLA